MYNGIGLATARGSGTNGYVQRNWAAIKKVKDNTSFKTDEELSKIDSAANRQPNQELLDHDRKRRVELKCIELEQSLEDQGYSQDEISKKINSFRVTLLGKPICGTEYDERGRPIMKDSHQFADEQLKKNARLRDAFGISEFFIEGSSLDPERKTKEAAMAQLKSLQVLQVDQTVEQTHMNDDTSTNKDSSIANELRSKSPKHKKRKKKKTKSHKTDKEKGSDKKKSKKHKKKHNSSSEDSPRNDTKISKSSFQVKSKNDDDRSNKVTTENNKKKYESENNHKKHLRDNDKSYKNDKKEVENKYKSDREDYRKKDSKSDNFKSSKKDKSTEESHKSKSKDAHESKKQDSSPRHKTPIKERARDRDRGYDKYSYRHQRKRDSSKSNKEKSDKKSDKGDNKYSSKKKNESPVKEVKKPIVQYEKLTCISSDSEKSCYTPPPKDMKAKHAKLNQSKSNEDKNVKSTKYTFSLREDNDDDDRLVVTKANGRTDNLKPALQNSENQHKKTESRKTNDRVDKIFLDSTSSEEGDLEEDIDLNIIKEITTEKIKKVFELHEKQEQALLHLKKKIMEKKHKVRTSSSSSESSEVEPVKKKSVKRRRARDSSSSNSDVNTRKKTKRSRSSSSSSNASDTSVDRRKSSSKRRSTDKYSKKKSPKSRRHTKGSTSRSRSRSASLSSNERSRKKRVSSSEESSPRHKRKSSKRKRSSRRQRSSDSSSSSRSSSSYKKKRRYSSSRSRSTSSSSMSSHYSRSSSSSHDSSSSVFSRSSKSRSASIPRRRGSPSFLDRRRITSARKRPIPYTRLTPFSTNSDTDSVISVHDSPFAEPLTWN